MMPINLPVFLWSTEYLRTWDVEMAKENVHRKFWKGMYMALYFWPVVNISVYTYCPAHLINPVFDLAGYVYSILLSYINNKVVIKDE